MSDWGIPLRQYVLVGSLFLSGCVALPNIETSEGERQAPEVVEVEAPAALTETDSAAPAGEIKVANEASDVSGTVAVTSIPQPNTLPQPRQDMQPTNAVKHWLSMAEQAFAKDHLTTPASDNAYAYYGRVLLQEPDNRQALAGLEKIVQRYLSLAKSSQRKGKSKQAQLFLQRANKVVPSHKDIALVEVEVKRIAASNANSKSKANAKLVQQRQPTMKFDPVQTQQQSVMEAPEGMQRQRILLPQSALKQEAPALALYLRRLARQIEEVDGRLYIIAPQDKQVRWVYSLLNGTNPDYRIRANMKHTKPAAIEVMYNGDEPLLDVFK